MTANTGAGLYIRKGHTGAFVTEAQISKSSNTKWMPVTSVATSGSTTSLAGATSFKGSFGYWNGSFTQGTGDSAKANDTMSYTAVSVDDTTKDVDAYTATVNGSETNGIYYQFDLDYMITEGKSLKVTAKATPSVETTPNIAQATRVGIIPATAVTVNAGKQMTGATYASTGKEYTVAAPATGTDYNLEELKALGYEGDSEYKDNLPRLDTDGETFDSTSLGKKTSYE